MNNNELQIIKLDKHDLLTLQKLVLLFQGVFEMENHFYTNKSYLKCLLENPHFIAFVVQNENEIMGGLTAYELPQYYFEYSELFLYDLAIKHEFQRKGFGKKLLLKLKGYCSENRIRTFFVEAHEEDNNAIDFYYSTGGKDSLF